MELQPQEHLAGLVLDKVEILRLLLVVAVLLLVALVGAMVEMQLLILVAVVAALGLKLAVMEALA
jgi:hypothetical protein